MLAESLYTTTLTQLPALSAWKKTFESPLTDRITASIPASWVEQLIPLVFVFGKATQAPNVG